MQPRRIQVQQFRRRHRGTEAGGDAGLRPGDRPPCGRHRDRLRQPAGHFDAERESQQEIGTAGRASFGQCQGSRGDGTRRMHHRLRMRIVIGVDAGCEAIDQTGVQRIGFVAAADHRGMRRSGEFAECRVGERHRRVPRAADRAAHDVDERAQRLAPHRLRQIGPARGDEVVGQPRGDIAWRVDECVGHWQCPLRANASRRRRYRSRNPE